MILIMSQKSKGDASASLVDLVISTNASTFAREGSLERVFLDMGRSLY